MLQLTSHGVYERFLRVEMPNDVYLDDICVRGRLERDCSGQQRATREEEQEALRINVKVERCSGGDRETAITWGGINVPLATRDAANDFSIGRRKAF
jgi:hypothetical protein